MKHIKDIEVAGIAAASGKEVNWGGQKADYA